MSQTQIPSFKDGFYSLYIHNETNTNIVIAAKPNEEGDIVLVKEEYTGDDSQIFYFKSNDDGYYTIISYKYNMCVGANCWLNDNVGRPIKLSPIIFD